MLNISDWQHNDFLNKESYEALKKEVDGFLFYGIEREAHDLYKELSKRQEIIRGLSDSNLKNDYQQLMLSLKLIALPRLDDKEVLEIVRSQLAQAFEFNQEDLDIKDKIKRKLANMLIYNRDEYKQDLIKALSENEQVITQSGLEINGKQAEGTIANWLKDYHIFMTEGQADEKLAKAEYLYKNKNLASLPEEDRAKINKLLDVYNSWHESSWTVAGREDPMLINDNGTLYGVYNGEIFEIGGSGGAVSTPSLEPKIDQAMAAEKSRPRPVEGAIPEPVEIKKDLAPPAEPKPVDSGSEMVLQKVWQAWLAGDLVNKIVEKQENIKEEIGDDVKRIRSKFYHAVNENQAEDALAALLILAGHKQLGQAFGEDERFINFWGNYLEKNSLNVEEFKNNPTNAKHLAMFFKYILEKRLSLAKDEAVMIGVLISNLSRQAGELEYQEMAYGDIRDSKFKWNF